MSVMRKLLPLIISSVVLAGLISAEASRSLILTVLALLLMIGIHELGHFLMAKHYKVETPEFSLGFGPKLFQTSGLRTGTKFTIRMIPLGGFVKIKGLDLAIEGEEPSTEETSKLMSETSLEDSVVTDQTSAVKPKREYASYGDLKTFPRVLIAGAGPFANIFSGFLILFMVFMFAGRTEWSSKVNPVAESPAARAGLSEGTLLLEVNGEPLKNFDELRPLVEKAALAGKDLELKVAPFEDPSKTRLVSVKPVTTPQGARIGLEGVYEKVSVSPLTATVSAFGATGEISGATLQSFGKLGSAFINIPKQLITGESSADRVVSPIGVARVAESSTKEHGWIAPVGLFAAVSFFIAFFNLLPLPPLDGFHIFQAVYESVGSKIRRRPVALDKGAVRAFTGLVTVCVLLLGVGALLLDILRPAVMP